MAQEGQPVGIIEFNPGHTYVAKSPSEVAKLGVSMSPEALIPIFGPGAADEYRTAMQARRAETQTQPAQ